MITVYHMSNKFLGEVTVMKSRVPKITAFGEDEHLPRICVAPSIIGCIYALPEFPPPDREITKMQWWLYRADLDGDDLLDVYHPDSAELPDAWETGEFWLLKPTVFDLERIYVAQTLARLVGTPYRWWTFTELDREPVRNNAIGDVYYGTPAAFSVMVYDQVHSLRQIYTRAVKHYARGTSASERSVDGTPS